MLEQSRACARECWAALEQSRAPAHKGGGLSQQDQCSSAELCQAALDTLTCPHPGAECLAQTLLCHPPRLVPVSSVLLGRHSAQLLLS